jgi:predicted metal-binding membrane protein
MASAAQPSAVRVRDTRSQVGVLASLLALTALAWLLTHERMLGMDAGPGTDPGSLGFYVLSWVVMMSAMMFPSIVPMVLTFGFVQRRRRDRGSIDRIVSSWVFVGGYLLIWTAFGLLAYGLYVGVRSISIPALSWYRGGPYLAGSVLLAAAIYQLTPIKDACLRRCRAPLEFVLTHWRDGPSGALRMGIMHGAWCVGCCWGLMAALFALGVMSLTWMVTIAGLITVEKLLPWRQLANRLVAVTLLALALGVSLAPRELPGLTLPQSHTAATAMPRMSAR